MIQPTGLSRQRQATLTPTLRHPINIIVLPRVARVCGFALFSVIEVVPIIAGDGAIVASLARGASFTHGASEPWVSQHAQSGALGGG